jgi:hypothetical protein
MRPHESVGVDRDEKVRAHLFGLVDPRLQAQVVVAVAREQRAHIGLGIHQRLQPPCDLERDVLLARAVAPDRPGILPAVAGVDDDRGETSDPVV